MKCKHGVDYPAEGPNGPWECEPDGRNPNCHNCEPDAWQQTLGYESTEIKEAVAEELRVALSEDGAITAGMIEALAINVIHRLEINRAIRQSSAPSA